MQILNCELPGGYWDTNGSCYRDIDIRALTGREEEILAGQGAESTASVITDIISRCLVRIGPISEISKDIARGLLVADRQYILLKLRGITFGDRVQATVGCINPDCGSKVDIDFSLNEIPVKQIGVDSPVHSIELTEKSALKMPDGKVRRDILFRLPDGSDQEILSPLIFRNESLALSMLLERCILQIGEIYNPPGEVISLLSPMARFEIEKAIESAAPRLDLSMSVTCPECRREFEIPFDLQEMFFGEFRDNLDLLHREVHCLAYHYHWSEREIMEMPKSKRETYIEILSNELERINYE